MEIGDSLKSIANLSEKVQKIPDIEALINNTSRPMLNINIPKMPEFRYEDSPRYVMDRQLEEIENLNSETRQQNEILRQNYNQLKDLYDIQKEQLTTTKEQNKLLQTQLDIETIEKEKAQLDAKKSKPWSIAGKVLAGIVGFSTFAIGIAVALYPEQCKEAIEAIIMIFATQTK